MLVVLSGRTASGKSTLAKAVAGALNGTAGSFGGYIRHLAEISGGDPNDRRTLQDLGQSLVEADAEGFVTKFLAFYSYDSEGPALVIDGLRHLRVLDCLRSLLKPPDKLILIYVDIDEESRKQRLLGRNLSLDEIEKIEQHPSEIDVLLGLSEASDLRVEGNLDAQLQIKTVLQAIIS